MIPTGTHIPTLVLAGQFDPNANPSLSRRVAEIVAAFIERPEQTPYTSCAQRPAPIRFLPLP